MQVLVLAAQNAVPYKMLGVATSGSTLFRQIGGAVGVSIFGAIFSNGSPRNWPTGSLRASTSPQRRTRRSSITSRRRCKGPFIEAFTAAITPIFLAAAGFAILAFLLTWLLREVPLRETGTAEGLGESFADAAGGPVGPRAGAHPQLDRERAHADGDLASGSSTSLGVPLTPAGAWLLVAQHGLEHVGQPLTQLTPEPGEERVAEPRLRGARSRPAAPRLARRSPARARVALAHDHVWLGAGARCTSRRCHRRQPPPAAYVPFCEVRTDCYSGDDT